MVRRFVLGVAVLVSVLAGPALAQAPSPPQAPQDPAHPGSASYAFAGVEKKRFVLKDSLFGAGYVTEVIAPRGATGKLPLVVFLHGKFFYFSDELYRAFHEHLARKGMIVADVEFEGYLAGALTRDHEKFARRVLRATQETLSREPRADASAITFVGHSLGARVALIAASMATGAQDPQNRIPDPSALVLHAFDDSRPPTGPASPAVTGTQGVAARIDRGVEVTLVEYESDAIAGPQKGYAQALYDTLRVDRKQWLRGKTFASVPALVADHLAPLSGGPSWVPGGSNPSTDALDRHLVWKVTAAVVLARSGRAPSAAPYAYGAERTHGGTASDGTVVRHEVVRQSF